jgi:hypothetical protein
MKKASTRKTSAVETEKTARAAKTQRSSPSPSPPPFPLQINTPSPDFSRGSISDSASLSISELPEEEKAKVARLVERLVCLAREHEELVQALVGERAQRERDLQSISLQFRGELQALEDQCSVERAECAAAQNKKALAVGLLSMYQERLGLLSEQRAHLEHACQEAREKERVLILQADTRNAHFDELQTKLIELESRERYKDSELHSAKEKAIEQESRMKLLEKNMTELQAQVSDLSLQLKDSVDRCQNLSHGNAELCTALEAKEAAITLAEANQKLQKEQAYQREEEIRKEFQIRFEREVAEYESRIRSLQSQLHVEQEHHSKENQQLYLQIKDYQRQSLNGNSNRYSFDEASVSSIRGSFSLLPPPHQTSSVTNTPLRSSVTKSSHPSTGRKHHKSDELQHDVRIREALQHTLSSDSAWVDRYEEDVHGSSDVLSSASSHAAAGSATTGLLTELVEKTALMDSRMKALGKKIDKKMKITDESKKKKKKSKKVKDSYKNDDDDSHQGWERQRNKRDTIPFIISHPLTKRLQSSSSDPYNLVVTQTSSLHPMTAAARRRIESEHAVKVYNQSVEMRYDPSLVELVRDIDPDSD